MAEDLTDAVGDSLHNALDKVKEKYAGVVEEGEKFVERAAEKVSEVKNDVSTSFS
jgi:hypothetical protein